MVRLTRRAFLLLSLALASVRAAAATLSSSVEDFLRVSRRLTGRKNLDAKVAATYLDALLAVPGNARILAALAGGRVSPASAALERTILEWWYTGTYELRGERRVATHSGALMWDAIGVTAPGTCGGAFGAWARAPRRHA